MKLPYLSVTQYVMWGYLSTGVIFLLLGVLNTLLHLTIAAFIVSLLLLGVTVFVGRCKRESFDEMADAHLNESYFAGYVAVMSVIILLVLVEFVGGIDVSMFTVLDFCFGAGHTTVGLMFRHLENEGDDLC